MEAKAAEVAERADVLAVDAGIQRLRTVFHNLEVVLFRERHDGGHIAGHSQQVDADDGFRLLGDLAQCL